MAFELSGVFSAQWLPTDSHGQLDRELLARHLAFERTAGIAGVLALGSTGEFPHFSPAQRQHAISTLVELAAPLPVMVNISDLRPGVAVELGRFAKSVGAPAVALMPPSFYPISPADMLAYFLHVAERVELPVMLYNFPELTGKRIGLETIAAFADRAPMIGIKQSGGEFAYHRELIALGREKRFVVMSGADTRLPEVFALGAAGCIGGLVNLVPEWMVALERICRRGQPGEHATIAQAMVEVGRIIDQLTFPINVAAGIEARGFDPGVPKEVISPASQQLHTKIVAELRALFRQHELTLGGFTASARPAAA
ncbi:dihydrodipicolinate synthase family protein [Opitutus sp. ER46]|uniref:dihydrodipicolinate synthase family protein n=1 Tax=Opitutus sp. ER46 TaxID=2161864 RepID=UPI000D3043E9|nr:dihydrodipicolinate synthase family protein [Opitutus sp. ER46]PTX97948.1 hypothetical protein DB354_06645 [Opitutus sp. ER46]